MKYTVEESLSNFQFWSGGKDRAVLLNSEQFDQVEEMMAECEPADGWTDTAINDFFWFDFDTIAQWLGYKNEEYLEKDISDDEIQEANDWFEGLDAEALCSVAELDKANYTDEDDGEVDYDAIYDDAQDWWENQKDMEKVYIFRKNDN